MKKRLFLLLAVLGVVMSSCKKQDSSDVNQAKIWTQYVLSYNKNNDVTDVVARFRFGDATGTILELSDSSGAKVTFNGQVMPYSTIWSAHHIQLAGNVTTGSFKYTNTQNNVYTNSVPTGADSIAFPVGFDTIVKSHAETFTWQGSALAPNQSVGVYIGTWAWDKDAAFYTDGDGATNMIFGVTEKSGLAVGPCTVAMARSVVNNSINAPSVGGVIRYTYIAQNASGHIVP